MPWPFGNEPAQIRALQFETSAGSTACLDAGSVIGGSTDGERFRAHVTDTLVPVLKRGDTLTLDNLRSHKVADVREAIEAAGVRILHLPAYSPDFNPIERAFATSKAFLRTAAARTVLDLRQTIRTAFSSTDCRNYITAAGYDPSDPT